MGIQKLFSGLRIAASALGAERQRVDVIAKNIAFSSTTRMPDTGRPYRREVVHFAPILERAAGGEYDVQGVRVSKVEPDMRTPFEQLYDPGHPDSDANGIVLLPNVNSIKEMADLITALRAYEANLKVAESFEQMAERALRLAE